MSSDDIFAPDVRVQRRILETKREQLRAQAFESELNATLNEVQLAIEDDKAERDSLLEHARRQRVASRQLYAAARECQRRLELLPEEPVAEKTEE